MTPKLSSLVLAGLVPLLSLTACGPSASPGGAGSEALTAASSLSVTNLNDKGPGSLRQAIIDAASGATITFAVTGQINLTTGELPVNGQLVVSGPGESLLTVSARQAGSALARVFNNIGQLTISGLTLRDGAVNTGVGGGILNAGTLVVRNVTFRANQAQNGAAIYNSPGAQLQVDSSTFDSNATQYVDTGTAANGAGIYNAAPGSVATITGSTFNSNITHDHGSALYNEATMTVTNSTMTLGQARDSAVYSKNGTLSLNNATITQNVGKQTANGLIRAGGIVNISNTLIAQNRSISTPLSDCNGGVTSLGHNLVGEASACGIKPAAGDLLGTSTAPIDAKLGPLQNNGGPTTTHALLTGSPAIDFGSAAALGTAGACAATDQRGVARPRDGDLNGSAVCDTGAFEK